MFRDVAECSGMSHAPDFIDYRFLSYNLNERQIFYNNGGHVREVKRL